MLSLSIEDSRFFQHNGFDLPRFLKSALNNLASGSLSQGGSTLTMQLVDNTWITNVKQQAAEKRRKHIKTRQYQAEDPGNLSQSADRAKHQ